MRRRERLLRGPAAFLSRGAARETEPWFGHSLGCSFDAEVARGHVQQDPEKQVRHAFMSLGAPSAAKKKNKPTISKRSLNEGLRHSSLQLSTLRRDHAVALYSSSAAMCVTRANVESSERFVQNTCQCSPKYLAELSVFANVFLRRARHEKWHKIRTSLAGCHSEAQRPAALLLLPQGSVQ